MVGGLGFRPLKLMNQALLGKWLQRIGDQSDGLWKEILMSKLCLSMEWEEMTAMFLALPIGFLAYGKVLWMLMMH